MEFRDYLIQTFQFNDSSNRKMLEKISSLPDPKLCVRHFSHLVLSQNKWMARILKNPLAPTMEWWEPEYPLDALKYEWEKSLHNWIDYLQTKSEKELFKEVEFTGFEGGKWKVRLSDIALQLNYHSIHHRAQMQLFIRQQGIEPDFIDYIGTKYQKLI